MDPKKIARINELAKKKKTEGLTPEEKVNKPNYVRSTSKVIVALFVITLKESKLWTKKETMLHQKNYAKYNVKKDYMAVVLMTQIHNMYFSFNKDR